MNERRHRRCHLGAFVFLVLLIASIGRPVGAHQKPAGRLAELSADLKSVADRVKPAVVQIFATGIILQEDALHPEELLIRQRGAGSGVILDPNGYIVTNAHVVQGATRIQVRLPGSPPPGSPGRSILGPAGRTLGAQIVGIDRETDLAVLKIEATKLPHLTLGDSEELQAGEIVLAFGSPMGLDASVTMGVVSATARQLTPDDPMIYLQTDTSINPGSSGGPLVDVEGRVVGINTFIVSQSGGSEGLGFAAPSNIVQNVFDQIRKTGRVRRGDIGVRAQTITSELAAGLGLPQAWGILLADVFPGGPAAQAGLAIGDVVVSLDGKVMENGRQFQVNLYRRSVGARIRVEILRGRDKRQVEVIVVDRMDDPDRFAELVSSRDNLVPELGILGLELTPQVAALLPDIRIDDGVVVAARSTEGPVFFGEQLEVGDVIHAVNRARVAGLKDLRAALGRIKAGEPTVLQIEREGVLMYLTLETQ